MTLSYLCIYLFAFLSERGPQFFAQEMIIRRMIFALATLFLASTKYQITVMDLA